MASSDHNCNSNNSIENPKLNELYNEINKLKEVIKKKDEDIRELEQKNTELKDEASKYQSALGIATSFDNEESNPVKLKDDMLKLQDSLEDYITTCKGDVEINLDEIQKLLKKYKSKTTITKDQKPLIKAVLQRHVIEKIFEYGEFDYFCPSGLDYYNKNGPGIENHLYSKIKNITYLTKILGERRVGVDDTTKVLSTKLRQQIFAALGNRGFNDIIKADNKQYPHKFISYYQGQLNKEIGRYRKLKDPEKKEEIEGKAGEIIQRVMTLFWFRLEIQEPIAQFIWFDYNDKIEPSYMEGTWDDDEVDNIAVDICYFPLIAQEFSNKSKRQIFMPARIFHKSCEKSEGN